MCKTSVITHYNYPSTSSIKVTLSMPGTMLMVLTLLFSLMTPAPTRASDADEMKDILAWLPYGHYSYLSHCDIHQLRESKNAEAFLDLFGVEKENSLFFSPEHSILPNTIENRTKSVTTATIIVRYFFSEAEADESGRLHTTKPLGDQTKKPGNRVQSIMYTSVDDRSIAVSGVGFTATVVKLSDPIQTMNSLIKKDELEETGLSVKNKVVFAFISPDSKGQKYHLVRVDDYTLLIAEHPSTLERMLEAGYGERENFFADAAFNLLEEYEFDFGQRWGISNFSQADHPAFIRSLQDVSMAPEKFDSLVSGPLTTSINSYYTIDQIKNIKMFFFTSEESAKKHRDLFSKYYFYTIGEEASEVEKEQYATIKRMTQFELEDTVLTASLDYSDEMVELTSKAKAERLERERQAKVKEKQ